LVSVTGGSNHRVGRTGLSNGNYTQCCLQNIREEIMAKSKPKKEKQEETTGEFVKRINQQQEDKRNGLKRKIGHHH